ncbi:outer membrane protein assembly factor BamB family protein, partial [Aurantivibrio plasticivorans]
SPQNQTPPKSALAALSPQDIRDALTSGVMRAQGVRLSEEEKSQIALFLSGGGEQNASQTWQANYCQNPSRFSPIVDDPFGPTEWNGWGRDLTQSRFQSATTLPLDSFHKLQLRWAFAYPGGRRHAPPSIVGNRLFTGVFPGKAYALDLQTGCVVWEVEVNSGVRNAVSVVPIGKNNTRYAALFGTNANDVFAVDVDTGQVLWQTRIDNNPVGRVTGAGIYHDGVFYVPMSSNEEVAASSPDYGCCNFRGSVTALDVTNGSILWKTYVIDEAPAPTKINEHGQQMFGPAGAAIWSAPSIDIKRGLLYVATGDSYTDVEEDGSDAIVAIELKTGNIRWKNQVTANDNFVIGCGRTSHGNCPEDLGPDYDFGSTPQLVQFANGKDVIIAGQKSGIVYFIDPDTGKLIDQLQLGRGGPLGGIQWGFANDGKRAYVAVADVGGDRQEAKPGLTAVDIATQQIIWHVAAPKPDCKNQTGFRCTNAFSQAVTVIAGIVFAGSGDGVLSAFDSQTGEVLWQYNTAREVYNTVNGVTVQGGALDGGGPIAANGVFAFVSGFNVRRGEVGNVLLVFEARDEKAQEQKSRQSE